MKNKKTMQHFLSAFLLISTFVVGSNLVLPKTSVAALFLEGGRSERVTFCSCSACFKIKVGKPKSGTFMYCPWYTSLYEHYNIFPNAWQLGKATMWMSCLQISYPKCRTDGGGYLLDMTGTSQ
jgi:hypothetical protein